VAGIVRSLRALPLLTGIALMLPAAGAGAAAISEFSAGLRSGAIPAGIGPGPDHNVWFTDQACLPIPPDAGPAPPPGSCAIGRITPSGAIAEYPTGPGQLYGLAAGPLRHHPDAAPPVLHTPTVRALRGGS
jgi:streptogramin lyase